MSNPHKAVNSFRYFDIYKKRGLDNNSLAHVFQVSQLPSPNERAIADPRRI